MLRNEFAIVIGVLQQRRRGFDRRFHLNESCAFERRCGAFRILKEPGLAKTSEVRGKLWRRRQRIGSRSKTREIRSAAALRLQPPSGKQCIVKIREQLVVIEHPVERGGADDAVEPAFEGQVQEIADYQTKSTPKLRRQMFARGLEHVLGQINADDVAFRQSFQQLGSEPSSSTSGIEHDLVAAQTQARQNFLAPTDLRCGKAVVDGRVPLACMRLGSVTHKGSATDSHGPSRIQRFLDR